MSSIGPPRNLAEPAPAQSFPFIDAATVAELDRLCSERFATPIEWLMEAAGWQLAQMCSAPAAVLCGTGGNGGDGLAAARHLRHWGRLHSVSCLDLDGLSGPARREADALLALGVEISPEPRMEGAGMVVDALFGTGLSRPPTGIAAEWIELMNRSGLDVLAVDIPSGLDADTGATPGPAVRGSATVTLALPKYGLVRGRGPELCGQIWVADIGIPNAALAGAGILARANLFAAGPILRLEGPPA